MAWNWRSQCVAFYFISVFICWIPFLVLSSPAHFLRLRRQFDSLLRIRSHCSQKEGASRDFLTPGSRSWEGEGGRVGGRTGPAGAAALGSAVVGSGERPGADPRAGLLRSGSPAHGRGRVDAHWAPRGRDSEVQGQTHRFCRAWGKHLV